MPSPIRVLHIDDNPFDRDLVRHALEKDAEGFQLTHATTQAEFEARLAANDYDVVLSDFNMLGFEGLQVIDAVHAKDPSLPVVIATGTGSEEIAVEALKRGAADYVIKTAEHIRRLPQTLHAVLGAKRLREESRRAEGALAKTERRFQKIFEHNTDGVSLFDANGNLTFVSPAVTRILGYAPEEFTRQLPLEITHPADRQYVLEAIASIAQTAGASVSLEYRNRHKDGSWHWVGSTVTNLLDEPDVGSVVFSFRDISERKRAEDTLRQRATELNAIYQAARKLQQLYTPQTLAREIIGVLEGALNYTYCAVLLIEETSGNLIPFAISTIKQEPDHFEKDVAYILSHQPRVGKGIAGWVAQHGESVRVGDVRNDPRYYGVRQDILSELCVPLRVGDKIIGVINVESIQPDVYTEYDQRVLETVASQIAVAIQNSRLFEEVEEARQRLLLLARKLVEVQEDERRGLARELHDQVGQALTALSLNFNIIRSQLLPDSAAKVESRLIDSAELVNEMVDRIRDVMSDLRPPVLDDYGLTAALHWYGDQFSKRTGLATVVRGASTMRRLPPQVETAFFRIAQEALTNIAKYSHAKNVTISVEGVHNMARLTIADDGIGFVQDKPQASGERKGLGLIGMKERAEAVKAQLRIESAPARGTKVIVEVGHS